MPIGACLVAQMVKTLSAMQETWVQPPIWEDPLEKGMVIHSSILAWRISWMEEPGSLHGRQSMGSQRVRHNWGANTTLYACWPTSPHFFHRPHTWQSTLFKFRFLDSTYKWDHAVFVFLWLICFIRTYFTRSIHIIVNGRISFFLMADRICIYPHLYLFICWWTIKIISISWILWRMLP